MSNSVELLPFQECTVAWVLKQLRKKGRSPIRFLVADEVGLGKTKIANRVIAGLLSGKKNLVAVYITSNLDISQQNRKELCSKPDKQIVHADRICLLYSKGYRKNGLKIISLTPSTSLNLSRGIGNITERAYIARYLARRFGVSRQVLIKKMRGRATKRSFEQAINETRHKAILPPERVCLAIDRVWKEKHLIEKLRSNQTPEAKNLVQDLRLEMARAILQSLRPDIVILDEVQKYSEIIDVNEKAELTHIVAKELLNNTTPTLLLSATPYRAFVGGEQILSGSVHVEELKKVLAFLTGSALLAQSFSKDIADYAKSVKEISQESLLEVLKSKKRLEQALMPYMTRAERINFEEGSRVSYIERMLPTEDFPIRKEHLIDWVKLKGLVRSKKAFLHLWRSGTAPLSYMSSEYKIFDGLEKQENKKLLRDNSLYTKLKSCEFHGKLKYLKKDLLAEGEIGKYLWIPPSRPYYPGGSIYSPERLEKMEVKKGLVFSSWNFVPRFVATELSSWQNERQKKKPIKHPLKDSLHSWGWFWHPSPWLACLVSHKDFLSKGRAFKDLHDIAKKRIATYLKNKGWRIGKSGTKSWEVLFVEDFGNRKNWILEIQKSFLNKHTEFTHRNAERGGAMPLTVVNNLIDCEPRKVISRSIIAELATVALSSPATCLLRTLYSIGIFSPNIEPDNNELTILSDFCARNWKIYFNRETTAKAIITSYNLKLSYAKKLQRYCRDGNIQAVLDEYIYHLKPGIDRGALKKILHKLSIVFGPKGGHLRIRVEKDRIKGIHAEQITLFGKTDELTQSRNTIREAFNSPFWPFILTTTSVGQEGLDFHLYCKDIYHWNLPSNPVDFEQREGRINRYNSLWVRSAIVQSVRMQEEKLPGFYWDHLYKMAPQYADKNDRYNLGMSPHWTYTPAKELKNRGYMRHILALPGTEEKPRYDILMKDLTLYRLTLGQPNQAEFLESLKRNEYLKSIDSRAITLCLFPYDHNIIEKRLFFSQGKQDRWRLLISDALNILKSPRINQNSSLAREVRRHIKLIRRPGPERQKIESIKALLYFVNPHVKMPDCTPKFGYEDDLKVLRNAHSD